MNLINPTVFVVDADVAAHEGLTTLSSSMNLPCKTYSSAKQFLDNYNSVQPGCLIIDMQLQDMDGLQLQEYILRHNYSLPVILMGRSIDVATAVRAMLNKAVTVLVKPFSANQMADAIRKALRILEVEEDSRKRQMCLSARFNSLDTRENEVLSLIVDGQPNKYIARKLDISLRTAARIRANVFKKVGAESAVDLSHIAIEYWGYCKDNAV